MWILRLNDMRFPKAEMLKDVARADSKEALKRFVEGEIVEDYRDSGWAKCFRQGGPLEWYNPPFDESQSFVFINELDYWLDLTRQRWERDVLSLPDVGAEGKDV